MKNYEIRFLSTLGKVYWITVTVTGINKGLRKEASGMTIHSHLICEKCSGEREDTASRSASICYNKHKKTLERLDSLWCVQGCVKVFKNVYIGTMFMCVKIMV